MYPPVYRARTPRFKWTLKSMPSEAGKKRQAQKREKRQASSRSAQKRTQVQFPPEVDGEPGTSTESREQDGDLGTGAQASNVDQGSSQMVNDVTGGVGQMKVLPRSCTGECPPINVCTNISGNMQGHFNRA